MSSMHHTAPAGAAPALRSLGPASVYAIGLGCMNLSHAYSAPPPREQAIALLQRALDLGITHFDTAALYGFGANESLIGPVLAPHRSRILLASKGGMVGVAGKRVIDGRPESLKQHCTESLQRLGTDVIDLYYLHRWDKSVPIEDSVGAMADLVRAGHIRAIGLSEVSVTTLERAQAVHPITAVQSEYSPWTRNPELGMLAACESKGIAFVAFSPVARGFLTDVTLDPATFEPKDIRRGMPRFQQPHYAANLKLLQAFRRIATDAGCTAAQLCLAWLLHRSRAILPIVGTTSIAHLEEDVAAGKLALDAALMARIESCVNATTVSGARYNEASQREIDTEEPA
jgi:aryl-alcohol dehydrogenase-like predicted oxidoreductase